MPGFVFLLAISGSFLCCFNSPAAPAAGEIRVQKKRAVSDAPEAWFGGCYFMDFSLHVYLKTLSTPVGQGRMKIGKTAVGFDMISVDKGRNNYGYRNRKSDSCVPAE
jgi:hypothetical protein